MSDLTEPPATALPSWVAEFTDPVDPDRTIQVRIRPFAEPYQDATVLDMRATGYPMEPVNVIELNAHQLRRIAGIHLAAAKWIEERQRGRSPRE